MTEPTTPRPDAADATAPCPPWPAEPFLLRLQACKSMLAVHGLLTDAEAERVQPRDAALRAKGEGRGDGHV